MSETSWVAASGHAGEAELTAWEVPLEMEKFDLKAGEQELGAVTMMVDLATAL